MCSCIPPKGARSQVQLYMRGADFVFAGTVTEIKWKVALLDSTNRDSRIMFRSGNGAIDDLEGCNDRHSHCVDT
jgi:hypothetical protein